MRRIHALRPVHLALGLPWIVAITASFQPIRDNSFLWHITAGSLQIEQGSVLTSDPFSFTRFAEPWRTQSWLADLLYSRLEAWTGLGFVPWMLAVVSLLVFGAMVALAFRASRSVAATAVVGIATAWIAAAFLSPRPVLFSYLFFVLLVVAVRDKKLYWVIPLLLWVWAGVHATYPVGILYVALEAWRAKEWRLVQHGFAGGVGTLLTAHGLAVVSVLLGFFENRGALGLITEWAVPDLITVRFLPIVPAMLLVIYGATRGKINSRDLIVIGPLLVFMLTASRAVFPAWIGLLPIFALALEGWWESSTEGNGVTVLNLAAIGLIVLLPLVFIGESGLDPKVFPVELAGSLSAGRVFHDDVVGGYLIYRFGGERQVFVDDRAELYGRDLFKDVIESRSGTPTWATVFAEWNISEALLSNEDALVDVLKDDGWAGVEANQSFVLLSAPSA